MNRMHINIVLWTSISITTVILTSQIYIYPVQTTSSRTSTVSTTSTRVSPGALTLSEHQISIHSLPNSILSHLWEKHGLVDIRKSPLASKAIATSITQSSQLQYRYHAKAAVPSIISCILRKDKPCFAYWEPVIHNLLIPQQFTLYVYFRFLNMHLDFDSDFPPESLRNLGHLAHEISFFAPALLHFDVMHLLQQWEDSLKLRSISHSIQSPFSFPWHKKTILKLSKTVKYIVQLLKIGSDAWRHEYSGIANDSHFLHTERLSTRLQFLASKLSLNPNMGKQKMTHALLVFREVESFGRYARSERNLYYRAYVGCVEDTMAYIPDLDAAASLMSTFTYPFPGFPDKRIFVSRIMDQLHFPTLAWRIGTAAIRHRRWDILRTMIEEECYVFLCAPIDYLDALSREYHQDYNILRFFMRFLVEHGGENELIQQDNLVAFRLILENGGLRLRYNRLHTEAVQTRNVGILSYLIKDIGMIDGIEDAKEGALHLADATSMTFLGMNS